MADKIPQDLLREHHYPKEKAAFSNTGGRVAVLERKVEWLEGVLHEVNHLLLLLGNWIYEYEDDGATAGEIKDLMIAIQTWTLQLQPYDRPRPGNEESKER